jgi:hypothetical protein
MVSGERATNYMRRETVGEETVRRSVREGLRVMRNIVSEQRSAVDV